MQPNVLLIILDSVRARNLSLYGHLNETTPFLESFAEEATVYTNARSPSIGSRPSHASLFTGYHAAETGISGSRKLKRGTTIWEELRDDGYETAVFSDNPFLRSNRYGFIHGFETVQTRPEDYVDAPFSSGRDLRTDNDATDAVSGIRRALGADAPVRSILNGMSVLLARRSSLLERRLGLYHDTSAETYLEAFETWLDERAGPWAACLNLMDAHYPYKPDPEFDRWGSPILRELQSEWAESNYDPAEFHDGTRPWWQLGAFEALYDGSIRQLDAAVKRIVAILENADCLDETLFVVTSDHGEAFGERSYFDPSHRLVAHGANGGIHDERAHVPLVVKFPGQSESREITAPASLTEFPAVVREAADCEPDAFVPDDEVLVTLDDGYEEQMYAVYESQGPETRMRVVNDSETAAVVIHDPQTKYLQSRQGSPVEVQPLDDKGISVPQESSDVDPSTRDHLRHLGYTE
jgi:arylsulfatase